MALSCPGLLSAQAPAPPPASFPDTESVSKNSIGLFYPEFTATSLDGEVFTDKQLKEKVTVINFWFATCIPCIAEMEALNKLYEKFENNEKFRFLSFTFDKPEVAEKAVKKHAILFPVCSVNMEESKRLALNLGFPTNIIVDQQGKMAFIKSGGKRDKEASAREVEKMEKIIEQLLSQ